MSSAYAQSCNDYESAIVRHGEEDYSANKAIIHTTFDRLIFAMKKIRIISERVLELIIENNDLCLLKKYTLYCDFVVKQSHSHYCEYADLHDATDCLKYLKLLV
jgi:hypothetical protein